MVDMVGDTIITTHTIARDMDIMMGVTPITVAGLEATDTGVKDIIATGSNNSSTLSARRQ